MCRTPDPAQAAPHAADDGRAATAPLEPVVLHATPVYPVSRPHRRPRTDHSTPPTSLQHHRIFCGYQTHPKAPVRRCTNVCFARSRIAQYCTVMKVRLPGPEGNAPAAHGRNRRTEKAPAPEGAGARHTANRRPTHANTRRPGPTPSTRRSTIKDHVQFSPKMEHNNRCSYARSSKDP